MNDPQEADRATTGQIGLVADIGGTNARFALVAPGRRPDRITIWPTAEFDTLEVAVARFLAQETAQAGGPFALAGVAVCAAGPLAQGAIRMTNSPWVVSEAGLREATGVKNPIVVNDFVALAHAIPALADDERRQIGGAPPQTGYPIGLIGPGTGLGVSALIPDDDDYIAIASEGGHVDLAPATAREIAILARLMTELGHVSAERVLSGPGLETLYHTLATLDDQRADPIAASTIAERAADGTDGRAAEAVRLFCAWLGATAGNLALTLGAKGGIYVGGGIVPKWGTQFDVTTFRRRFEAKGRFGDYMRAIPTYVMTAPEPAFIGLSRLLAKPRRTA